jgi:hypothetical protein
MTRQDAEQLVRLLGLLYADPAVPPEFRRSVSEVQGLALAALSLAPDEQHSVKAPARLRVVS